MPHKLLIVDDDTKLLGVLKAKFHQAGYEVLLAKDGQEGLDVALREHPSLILLDLRMPKMSGDEMLRQLRQDEWGQKVPVLVLTNSDGGHTVYLNIKDDVQGFFVKAEVSLKDLIHAAQQHIEGPAKP